MDDSIANDTFVMGNSTGNSISNIVSDGSDRTDMSSGTFIICISGLGIGILTACTLLYLVKYTTVFDSFFNKCNKCFFDDEEIVSADEDSLPYCYADYPPTPPSYSGADPPSYEEALPYPSTTNTVTADITQVELADNRV